jgi:hypothetical protein
VKPGDGADGSAPGGEGDPRPGAARRGFSELLRPRRPGEPRPPGRTAHRPRASRGPGRHRRSPAPPRPLFNPPGARRPSRASGPIPDSRKRLGAICCGKARRAWRVARSASKSAASRWPSSGPRWRRSRGAAAASRSRGWRAANRTASPGGSNSSRRCSNAIFPSGACASLPPPSCVSGRCWRTTTRRSGMRRSRPRRSGSIRPRPGGTSIC